MKDFLKGILFVGLFIIPFIPLIVTDSMFFPFITGKNFTFRIIVEITFAAWALLALLDSQYRPRFSWLLSAASVFLVVMFFANLLGEYPQKSFWSNFERMDGYVTLIHFYIYFVVLASTLGTSTKLWAYYLWTTVGAAGYAAFEGLQQSTQGIYRVDSTLGNSAYMAVYMLFNVFFSLYLLVVSKQWWSRGIAGLLFVLFLTVLILTSTRGTFLGLVSGLGITVLYIALFAKAYPVFRKIALGSIVVMALSVGGLFAMKDSELIKSRPDLERLANISLSDLDIRFTVWSMAYEGFKERPLLGWGQGNFNYIFNEQYDPDLYRAEAWYDRAHNIVFDWLTAGGILGLLAYVSIFLSIAYYLLLKPLFSKDEKNSDDSFGVPEKALFLGLAVGYFVHNLVVFDNIISYIFFAVALALVHGKVGETIPQVESFRIDSRIVTNILTPVVALCMGTLVYFVNLPGINASSDIIDALQSSTIEGRLQEMKSAIDRDSFAYQEVVEQFAQQAIQISNDARIAPEQKRAFVAEAENELLTLAAKKPGDARVHVFIAGFYRSVGALEESKKHIQIARDLSPNKQAIIMEQGILAYQMQDYEAMRDYFKEAFELQTNYRLARTYYAVSYMYTGEFDQVRPLLESEADFKYFAENDFALSSANQFQQLDLLKEMFAVRIEATPNNLNNRTSLAFVLYSQGDVEGAIAVLNEAAEVSPDVAERLSCYVANLEAGNEPTVGCEAVSAPAN